MQAPFWSQGLNRYSYVFNNPINATDPSGFQAAIDWANPVWNTSDFIADNIIGGGGSVGSGAAGVSSAGGVASAGGAATSGASALGTLGQAAGVAGGTLQAYNGIKALYNGPPGTTTSTSSATPSGSAPRSGNNLNATAGSQAGGGSPGPMTRAELCANPANAWACSGGNGPGMVGQLGSIGEKVGRNGAGWETVGKGLLEVQLSIVPVGRVAGFIGRGAGKLVPVTRWGRPGLQVGDWVQKGKNTLLNWIKSGKGQPSWVPGGNIPAPRSAGETFLVPKGTLRFPRAEGGKLNPANWVKYALGQRQYLP